MLKKVNRPTVILATHNKHKAREIEEMLENSFEVKTMGDFGLTDEIVEDGTTIEENADIKVNALAYMLKGEDLSNVILMADDTGLFVDALDGAPGVYSARYAGENCSYDDNNQKLLKALEGESNRKAHFSTSLALLTPNNQHVIVTSRIDGKIAEELMGEEGFGYDPLFIENTTGKTYAQMSASEKNTYSHRRAAVEEAKVFLEGWK